MGDEKNFWERYGVGSIFGIVVYVVGLCIAIGYAKAEMSQQGKTIEKHEASIAQLKEDKNGFAGTKQMILDLRTEMDKYNLAVLDYKVTQLQTQVKESNDKADRILLLLK